MDTFEFLREITALPGPSGYEQTVAERLRALFAPLCDEAQVDAMGSMIAVQRGTGRGPRVMLTAHIDEVCLVTYAVEKDGSVRFFSIGIAPHILPAQVVRLLTREGAIYGVVGALPPHLQASGDRKRAYGMDELFIDTGLAPERVRELVPPGTFVQLVGETTRLAGTRAASKTMDDRACAAILFACAEQMKSRVHDADVYYVLAAREEFDSLGAITCSHRLAPDLAFVLDVTHGSMEGCAPGETFPIDATVLSVGPNLHRGVTELLRAQAKRLHMKTVDEIYPGYTCTDAWWVQVAREGIPCALLNLPLKYMHTTVELCDLSIIDEQARLLCDTVAGLPAGWEETLCC